MAEWCVESVPSSQVASLERSQIHGGAKTSRRVRSKAATALSQPPSAGTIQRRATSDTRAPGASVSSTIRAFSSADERRRRPGPVSISIRRKPPFASSLTSYITIARSPLPQPKQALPGRPLKKGIRAPLTFDPPARQRQPRLHQFRVMISGIGLNQAI